MGFGFRVNYILKSDIENLKFVFFYLKQESQGTEILSEYFCGLQKNINFFLFCFLICLIRQI